MSWLRRHQPYGPPPTLRITYSLRIRAVIMPMSYMLILSYKYIINTNNGSLSYIQYPYVNTKVNINALRCINCNVEKVNVNKLIKVIYTNRCTYGNLCCVTCQRGRNVQRFATSRVTPLLDWKASGVTEQIV